MITLPNGVRLRDFFSPEETRDEILRRVKDAYAAKFPMENDRVAIHLDDLDYDHKKAPRTLEDHQDALLKGGRLSIPLRGKVRLIDKKFNVPLDEKEVTLANVPWLTDSGSFVINGNSSTPLNQQRLKPGVYAREKDNGELESHINVKAGTGPSMRLFMEPSTGIYRVSLDKSNIKLYPVLHALGVPDEKLAETWGPEILKRNQEAFDKAAFPKFYAKLLRNKALPDANDDERKAQVLQRLGQAELDPETTNRTLGRPHANLTLDTFLDASKKLLHVGRGEAEPDDRDHPANRSFHSIEDFMEERVRRDAGRLANNLLYRATYDRSLKQLRPGYFTPQLESLVIGNPLTQLSSGTNPVSIYDQHKRVIQMGEGGVSDQTAMPMSSRQLHAGHVGMIDPIRSSESQAIGTDQRFSIAAKKGDDGHIYFPVRNKRTGATEYVNPVMLHNKVLSFGEGQSLEGFKTPLPAPAPMSAADMLMPKSANFADLKIASAADLLTPKKKPVAGIPTTPSHIPAVRAGKLEMVPTADVDYELISPAHQWTESSNMVPMMSTVKGARTFIASKMQSQALPLVNPEAPLIDTLDDETGRSYHRTMADKVGTKKSHTSGVVKKVSDTHIDLDGDDGKTARIELKKYFPSGMKTYTTERPIVKVGDRVERGQPVAHNNFVDQEGRLAMGKNLAVAFMPAPHGSTFEDAITVSQSAAKKMTSPHMFGFDVEHRHGVESNKSKFISLFPNLYTNEQLDKIGENGMIKPGAKVQPGDPVVLSYAPRTLSSKDAALGNLHKVLKNSYEDLSQTWDKATEGTVAHAVEHRKGLAVKIVTHMPLKEGDKMSGRHGAKGVVGRVLPDEQMIQDKDGKPLDVIINPAALIGRVNPGMVFEALLGKIAHAKGKRYNLPSFSPDDYRDFVEHELKAHGMSDTEDLVNPETGRPVPKVITGHQYFQKLEHTSEGKLSGRGDSGGYDLDEQPAKGGDEGGKRLGGLQQLALLSHGVPHVLQDAQLYRGSSNPEVWRKIRMGESLPPPKTPFIYDKFLNTLKAAGINVNEDRGGRTHLTAMTDKDVDALAPYEIQNAETLHPRTAEPIKGGLMDYAIHGGPEGRQFSHIKLDEPMPSPVMEDPIRRILGITEKHMRGIIAGTDHINGRTGPQALHDALKAVNLEDLAAKDQETIRSGRKTKRDEAVRRLHFIRGLQAQGMRPEDTMITKVPVIPPVFRPIHKVGDMMLTSDANYLYRDLMAARDAHRENKKELPDSHLGDERLAIYDAIKAIQGMGDSINAETAAKGVKGFIKQVAGVGGPKCYDDQTEILTENGWHLLSTIDPSLKVATLNPTSEEMEFQVPLSVTHEHYNGPMVHTQTGKLDLLVTPTHRHHVQAVIKRAVSGTQKEKRIREWQDPGKVWARDLVGKTQRIQYFVAASAFRGHTPDYSFGGKTVDPDAFAEFVGFWIAEGFFADYDRNAVVIAMKAGTPDADRMDDVLSRLGLKFGRRIDMEKKGSKFKPMGYKTVWWRIRDRELAAWIKANCGSGASGKMISPEILKWEQKHQLALLKAYLDGDGEKRETKKGNRKTYRHLSSATERSSRFSTTSPRLVDGLELLCLQCGLGFRRANTAYEGHKKWAVQYRCRIYGWNKVVVEYPEQTRLIPEWSGMVHCVTVPNGLVFVRRNGRVAVSGNSGMFMSKVIGHPVNAVGRGVVVPNSDLDMDQVGMPERMAWKTFEAQTMRSMVKAGMPAVEAAKRVEKQTEYAKKHLLQAMEENPVLMSRDPALHRFSIMGLKARLVPGDNIHVSPLLVKPYGMDFDGDQANIHVPITDRAKQEVLDKMMPSKNLLSIKDRKVHYLPSQEFVLGVFGATNPRKGQPVKFASREEAIKAYRAGLVPIDQPIEIG